jgi:TRAP-type C4-dicarboxylate transport system permease small subunit
MTTIFMKAVLKTSKFLYVISGCNLVIMMLLTVSEVILRKTGISVTGAFELVTFASSIVVSFAIPYTTWRRGHVYMEFIMDRMPEQIRKIANVSTRIIGIALCALAAYYLVDVGIDVYGTGEHSPTLRLPLYPFAFAVSLCFWMTCFVLFCDILRLNGEEYE